MKLGLAYVRMRDWENFNKLTETLDKDLNKGAIEGQRQVVMTLHRLVKSHLRNQDLPWEPLSPNYRDRKRDNRDKILIERWRYYNNIEVFKPQKDAWLVGVRADRYYKSKYGRISISRVAFMHERGNNNLWGKGIKLPKRPLWVPSMQELNLLGIDEIIIQSIQRKLKTRGWKPIKEKLKKYKAPI
jgi:hypothetical protein